METYQNSQGHSQDSRTAPISAETLRSVQRLQAEQNAQYVQHQQAQTPPSSVPGDPVDGHPNRGGSTRGAPRPQQDTQDAGMDRLAEINASLQMQLRQQQQHQEQQQQRMEQQIQRQQQEIQQLRMQRQPRPHQDMLNSRVVQYLEALDHHIDEYERNPTYDVKEKLGHFRQEIKVEILYHRDSHYSNWLRNSYERYDRIARQYNPQHQATQLSPPPSGMYADMRDSKVLQYLEVLDDYIDEYAGDPTFNVKEKLDLFKQEIKVEILYHRQPAYADRLRSSYERYNRIARQYNPQHQTRQLPPPPSGLMSGSSQQQLTGPSYQQPTGPAPRQFTGPAPQQFTGPAPQQFTGPATVATPAPAESSDTSGDQPPSRRMLVLPKGGIFDNLY
ncbi:hypothetical protein P171DRAFT_503129 [Karstenula rhodostoma CBS 690.94]|uniref:Uncharacterized protein n=1 Tax=Karstenula rhodostoma CBS 690.94 TaxID=1392251 RepID=A0A9P4PSJ6_9PLEO|nr:hypothetical protein P171DRAFT_503129 [Karstenula rhodostoma CBS 690.94]